MCDHTAKAEDPAAARAARQPDRRLRLRLVVAAVAAVALPVAAWLAGVPPATGPPPTSWWMLTLAFVLAELCVVQVHFRRSTHSFTLGDIPLILGLMWTGAIDVSLAWMLAASAVLLAQRTPVRRVAFNAFVLACTVAVAAAVFALFPHGGASDHSTWVAAVAAVLASALVGALLVALAVSVSERSLSLSSVAAMLAGAVVVGAANVCLALAVVVVFESDPAATVLLAVPAALVLASYRAYLSERRQHERLELLYDVSRALSSAPETSSAMALILARLTSVFRADLAETYLFDESHGGPTRTTLGPDQAIEVLEPLRSELRAAVHAATDGQPAHRFDTSEHDGLRDHLRARGVCDAMIAPLSGTQGVIGAVVVAASARAGGSFTTDELRLFDTLVQHTGATLEKRQLGRQLVEMRDLQEHLEHQAFHDPLTGLANRLLFHDRVVHALSRRAGNVAVMYIDLDDFKSVNDTLGHDAGDALLVATAERLDETLRASDTAARLGGDEFAVLLTDLTPQDARRVGERILERLRRPVHVAGHDLPVKASLGIAICDSGELDADLLLTRADAAMYAAKHGGKGTLATYEPVAVKGAA